MTMTKEEAQKAYDDLIAYRQQNVLVKSKENPGKIEVHHIVPISMNGLDEELNKVLLFAKEHFMAHVYLWVIHHDDGFHDQMVCALMNMHKGTKNGLRKELREFVLMSEEYQLAKEEFGKYCSKTIPQKVCGSKNGMYGKHWIRNPQTREHKLVSRNDQLPDGWEYGRYQNMTEKFKIQIKKFSQSCAGKHKVFNPMTNEAKFISLNEPLPDGFEKRGRPLKEQAKQKLRDFHKKNNEENIAPRRIKELRPMYKFYLEHGWNAFKSHFNYQHSQQNFVMLCKRYLPEYVSHQGEKQVNKLNAI